jgi:predicted dehydrogenase
MLRLGLVGAGLIGEVHSLVLQQVAARWHDRVVLAAVAEPDAARRERFARDYGWQTTFADGAALIAEADVDAVFLCTPTHLHHAHFLAAAARGLDVFCEKPLAMSLLEARDMLAVAEAAGIRTQIGLVLRFSAVYGVVRDLLRAADTGPVRAVVFRNDQCFPIRGLHDTSWRADRARTAGGVLIEHSVHDLDLLVWLFGPLARLRARAHNHAGHEGVEDHVAVDLEFESGLRAQLLTLWHDMAARTSHRRLEVFCQRAWVASDHDMLGDVTVQRGDGLLETLAADEVLRRFEASLARTDHTFRDGYGIPYALQDLAFIEALLEGRRPSPDLADGVEAQRLAEAVYEAARTGDEIVVGARPL